MWPTRQDTFHQYTYDAEGRILTVDAAGGNPTTYVYDAMGHRVQRTTGGVVSYFGYDLAGHDIVEYQASAPVRFEGYAGSRHLVTYSNTLTYFDFQDVVGTERVHMTQNGASSESTYSLPFGDGQYTWGSGAGLTGPTHFTGKERDSESNLDYFGARYYSSTIGRFMTPDWAARPTGVPYAVFGDPQSLNLYGYVRNDPVTRADADGHDPKKGAAACDAFITENSLSEMFQDPFDGMSPDQSSAQNTSSNSDKRTDVMLTPDSVPPKPAVTQGAQFEMDYKITPQADTMKQLQDNVSNTRDDKATQANYSKMDVKLWESQRGGKWQWQGDPLKGYGHDVLNVFAKNADQRWYIDGKRVQLVIGKDGGGNLIKAWTVHVEIKPTGPVFSKGD